LNTAEKQTGVPKVFLVGGVAAVAIFLVLFLFGFAFIVRVIVFVVPAVMSFRSTQANIETEQWGTYWLLHGGCSVVEHFEDTLLYYVPIYHFAKLFVLAWAFMPHTKGAQQLYNLANMLLKKEKADGGSELRARVKPEGQESPKDD